jgi:hypothetical protein
MRQRVARQGNVFGLPTLRDGVLLAGEEDSDAALISL